MESRGGRSSGIERWGIMGVDRELCERRVSGGGIVLEGDSPFFEISSSLINLKESSLLMKWLVD